MDMPKDRIPDTEHFINQKTGGKQKYEAFIILALGAGYGY